MRLFKRITALALAAVTAGAMGLGAAAEVDEQPVDEEYTGGYTLEERANWGIEDYAENIKSVFKLTYPDEADVIDEIVDAITNSDVFAKIFEEDAREAFQIVEDSLRDALEPSAMPIDQDDERDFSKYDVPLIKQTAADEISSAAAAATMALIGCGASGYSQNSANNVKSQLNSDSSTNITIHKITNLLKKNKKDVSVFSYRTMAFTPKNITYSRASNLFDCLSYALVYDTVPVIRIDDTSRLSYYKGKDIKRSHYLVVTQVDHLAECITVYDPNNDSAYSGSHILDYYEVENLLVNSKVLWVSAFACDKKLLGLANAMAEYPDGSYYNKRTDGRACTCHDWCEPGLTYQDGEYCTCYMIDGGTQCVAFARYVFNAVKGRNEKESQNNSLYYHPVWLTVYNAAETAKQKLSSLSVGTYVRVCSTSTYVEKKSHSFVIMDTSENNITIYHANYGTSCLVRLETIDWQTFVNRFKYIQYYVV